MRVFSYIVCLSLSSGCLISKDHVSTELLSICTEPVLMPYLEESPGLFVAEMDIEGVGRTVEADAYAGLATLEISPLSGVESMGFASSITIDILAPGSALPDVRIAEVLQPGPANPMRADGDLSINLAEYLTSEALSMRVEVAGDAPVNQFAAELAACLDVDGIKVDD